MQIKLYRKAGENITPGRDIIDGWTYAGSGTRVQKIGRTTGVTTGVVSSGTAIIWQGGHATVELSIAMPQANPGGKFAGGGYSGALIFTEADQSQRYCQAVGFLHGRNLEENDLAVYTPMWAVMEMVAQGMGGEFEVLPVRVDSCSTRIQNSE